MSQTDSLKEFADLGVATVYEAAGRAGIIDLPLTQLLPGSSVAGRALTVACGQGDNLMVHAAIEHVKPGDIVVVAMPEPEPVALVGDLLAAQMKIHGAVGLVLNSSVRDVTDLTHLGLPIWSSYVRVKGATKTKVGSVGEPVTIGGCEVRTGDIVVLDADGAVVVSAEREAEVLEKARARMNREESMRQRFAAGETSYDIHGLRAVVEGTKS